MEIKINVPDGRVGQWEIQTFHINESDALIYNMMEMRSSHRFIVPGEYKRLVSYDKGSDKANFPTMSNTRAEVLDHLPFIMKATGDVLIFGLGLGMVVQALIEKLEVKSITVIEKEPDVIKLSGEFYEKLSPKVKIIHGDALTYNDENPFDAIWCDIWDDIDSENSIEMSILKDRWKKKCPLIMCWAEIECEVAHKMDI